MREIIERMISPYTKDVLVPDRADLLLDNRLADRRTSTCALLKKKNSRSQPYGSREQDLRSERKHILDTLHSKQFIFFAHVDKFILLTPLCSMVSSEYIAPFRYKNYTNMVVVTLDFCALFPPCRKHFRYTASQPILLRHPYLTTYIHPTSSKKAHRITFTILLYCYHQHL